MSITRAQFLRGLGAGSLLLPAALQGATAAPAAFQSSLSGNGVKPWSILPPPRPGTLRFAVIGDNTGVARPGVFDQALKQIRWLQPDFIMSVGDFIEGYTEDKAEIDRQWTAIEKSVTDCGIPFLYMVGNHDMNNAETKAAWTARRGAPYYSFTYKGALFLVLNTDDDTLTPMSPAESKQFYYYVEMMQKAPKQFDEQLTKYLEAGKDTSMNSAIDQPHIGGEQVQFVHDTLAAHTDAKWTFVFLHKPAWKNADPAFARIQAMLKGRRHSVFAGHTHYFTHQQFDGADYINMATTGGIKSKIGPGTMDHVMLVTLTAEGPAFANQRLTGLMDVAGNTGQSLAY